MTGMIIAAVVAVPLLIIGIYIGATYNALVKLKNSVEEAFSTMDVYLKKRWDLIPNIVESVKGYAKHEAQTLQNVISARNMRYTDMTEEQKLQANTGLARGLAAIHVLAEQYPDLKANQNFLDLNNQLQRTEEDIANARKYYNAVVRNYNNKTEMFPSSIVAKSGITTIKQRCFRPLLWQICSNSVRMFVIEDETEKEAVRVQF